MALRHEDGGSASGGHPPGVPAQAVAGAGRQAPALPERGLAAGREELLQRVVASGGLGTGRPDRQGPASHRMQPVLRRGRPGEPGSFEASAARLRQMEQGRR